MVILENIDIDIDIDKAILQNIDIDKISNQFKFGISNRAIRDWSPISEIYWFLRFEEKKFTIQIKFFADEKYVPLDLYEYMNI